MLNPFPALLSFSLLGPFFLRVVVGTLFLLFAMQLYREISGGGHKAERLVAWGIVGIEGLSGVSLVLGYYTQIGAILGSGVAIFCIVLRTRFPKIITESQTLYILLLTISLSLIFTGAGAFAFDLPL